MKISKFFTFLTASFLSIFFISCSDIFEARQATLVINLPESVNRAIHSQSEISYYNVTVTELETDAKEERLKCEPGKSIYFESLENGIYRVHIDAFNKTDKCIAASDDENPDHTIVINGQTSAEITVSMLKYFSASSIKAADSNGLEVAPVKDNAISTFLCTEGEQMTFSMIPEDGVEPYHYKWTLLYTEYVDGTYVSRTVESEEPQLEIEISSDSLYTLSCEVSDSAAQPAAKVSTAIIYCPDQAELSVKQKNNIASVTLLNPYIRFGSYTVLMDEEVINTIDCSSKTDSIINTCEVELNESGEKTFTVEYSAELADGTIFETQKTYTVTFDKIVTGIDAVLKSTVTKTNGYAIGDFIVSRLYKDNTQSAPLSNYSVSYKTREAGYVPVTIKDTETGFEKVLNNVITIWTADNSVESPSIVNRSLKQNQASALLADPQGLVYPVYFHLTPGGEAQSIIPYSVAYQWYTVSDDGTNTAISGATDISYMHPENMTPGVYHYICEATFIKNSDAANFISFTSAEKVKIYEAKLTVDEYVGEIKVAKSFNGSDDRWTDVVDYISGIANNYEPVVIALEGTFSADTQLSIVSGKNPAIQIIAKESGAEIIDNVSVQSQLFTLGFPCYFALGGEGTGCLTITGKSSSSSMIRVDNADAEVHLNSNVILHGNDVGSSYGGAIYIGSGSVTVDGAVINYNCAELGGGIYAVSGTLVVTEKSTIENNTVKEGFTGGNIYAKSTATVTINGETFSGSIYTLEENLTPITE